LPQHLTLFYSNRTTAAAAFMRELEEWSVADPRFSLVATLTEADPSRPWAHERGRFTAGWLQRELADRQNPVYYVAGPERFVKGMRAVLAEAHADPDEIRSEEFPGY
jgi:ferredoxin-NADP reductase